MYEVHTPTKSEIATFQVLANMDFVNLDRVPDNNYVEEQHEDVDIRVVDVEDEIPEENVYKIPTPLPSPRTNLPPKVVESPLPPSPLPTAEQTRENSPSPPLHRTKNKYKESNDAEIEAEKEGLLNELRGLERSTGAKPVRPLTMDDSLEEIQFQYDRIQAEINASQMVDFAKSAIKMGSGMAEMLMKKAGVKVIDGYHTNLCKDMNKFNRPLGRLYKKYWRRGGLSPEAELGMIVLGSLAWTVVQNKMGSTSAAFGGNESEASAAPAPRPSQMKPPQMSSLNIPPSWSSAPAPAASAGSSPTVASESRSQDAKKESLLRETEEKLRLLEAKREEIEQRDIAMRRFVSTLEERSQKLELRERAVRDAEEYADAMAAAAAADAADDAEASHEKSSHADSTVRTVVLNTTTPKKSARSKKSVAINI